MLTKKQRKTQKKLLEQREEARTQAEALASENERLKGDVNVLAAEEIRKATTDSADAQRKAEAEAAKAYRERDALLKDFDKAIAVHLNDTKKELEFTATKLMAAQREVVNLVGRNSALNAELDAARRAIEGHKPQVDALTAELASLKMEDTKQLRKRLQAKTERVAELERELVQAKSKPAGPITPAVPGLSALLNAKLRRKLAQDGQVGEAPGVVAAAPAPSEATPTP